MVFLVVIRAFYIVRFCFNFEIIISFLMEGTEFLKLQFITSKKREKAFQIVVMSMFLTVSMIYLVTIAMRNDVHSIHHLTRSFQFSWLTSILAFLLFVVLETIVAIDEAVYGFLTYVAMYFTCFSIKFWVQQIW